MEKLTNNNQTNGKVIHIDEIPVDKITLQEIYELIELEGAVARKVVRNANLTKEGKVWEWDIDKLPLELLGMLIVEKWRRNKIKNAK